MVVSISAKAATHRPRIRLGASNAVGRIFFALIEVSSLVGRDFMIGQSAARPNDRLLMQVLGQSGQIVAERKPELASHLFLSVEPTHQFISTMSSGFHVWLKNASVGL
jgi:hypothetical protein